LLKRYLLTFSRKAEALIKEDACNLLEGYSLICFIAQQISHKAVWKVVIDLYNWIGLKHPDIFEPVYKEIESERLKTLSLCSA
jgi:hypothetical protein